MQSKNINTIQITFNLPLHPGLISKWRGAVIEAVGVEKDWLHNHYNILHNTVGEGNFEDTDIQQEAVSTEPLVFTENKLYHRYPLVQYRAVKGKAAIFAMGEGIDAISKWLFSNKSDFRFNGKEYHLKIDNIQEGACSMELHTEQCFTYRLLDWIALNEKYYAQWRAADNLIQRVELLNHLLNTHIMTFTRGVSFDNESRIEAQLLNLTSMKKVSMHNMNRIAFNVLFRSNLLLPDFIALGRATAFGFGRTQGIEKPFF